MPLDHYWDDRWAEVPPELKTSVTWFLKGFLHRSSVSQTIRNAFAKYGPVEWLFHFWEFTPVERHGFTEGAHLDWGMALRNVLREVGFGDELLPDSNWDDYYIQAVEASLGLRP